MVSDSELLRRFAAESDEEAFAELVHRHLGLVYNAALRRANGNAHLAEEAAQIVFTQLSTKAHALSRHSALPGWLHTSTRYATSALIRAEQRRAARETAAHAMNSEPEEHNAVAWETLRPLVDEALDRLNAADRSAVIQRFLANKSYAAIAAELGGSEDGARKRVDRAIERLRAMFARHGVRTSASALALALTHAPAMAVPEALAGTVIATAKVAAAATAGGSIVSAALGFMAMAKNSTVALAACSLVGLASLGTAVAIRSDQQRAERQIDAMQAEAAAIRSRIGQLARANEAGPKSAGPSKPASGAATSPAQQNYDTWREMHENPAYAPLLEQFWRLRVQQDFGPFLATHTYQPAKVEALRRAAVVYYDAMDAASVRAYRSASDGGAVMAVAIDRAKAQFREAIKAVFTEAEATEIGRCFDAQSRLGFARNISYELAYAGQPMNRIQELALATVLAESDRTMAALPPAERREVQTLDPQTGLSRRDRNLLDDAAAFLSPAQLTEYEGYLRRDQQRMVLSGRARAQVQQSLRPSPSS